MAAPPREAIQKQIQQDWVNREYIEVITVSIKKITDFLNSFDLSCRSKLAVLNEKLTTLERKIDYLEACVSTSTYVIRSAMIILDVLGHQRRDFNLDINTANKFTIIAATMYMTCARPVNVISTQKRNLFHWINIIFNKVDDDRRRLVGPDRSCAEWLLRNGAYVKWVSSHDFLTDYNALPTDDVQLHIQEVDATDSSIMHYGFPHFVGCNYIRKIIFHKCNYLENSALSGLAPLKNSLSDLQVSSCLNISEAGLVHLKSLENLKSLLIFDLPYVKDKEAIVSELQQSLPKCKIQFK